MDTQEHPFDAAAAAVVALGNQLAESQPEASLWDIADGLLAGAVHFWLYSHQPCGDPQCEECVRVQTAEARMAELREQLRQYAEESEYYHSPTDINVGRA